MLNSLQTIKQEQFLNALLDELEKIEERFKRETCSFIMRIKNKNGHIDDSYDHSRYDINEIIFISNQHNSDSTTFTKTNLNNEYQFQLILELLINTTIDHHGYSFADLEYSHDEISGEKNVQIEINTYIHNIYRAYTNTDKTNKINYIIDIPSPF